MPIRRIRRKLGGESKLKKYGKYAAAVALGLALPHMAKGAHAGIKEAHQDMVDQFASGRRRHVARGRRRVRRRKQKGGLLGTLAGLYLLNKLAKKVRGGRRRRVKGGRRRVRRVRRGAGPKLEKLKKIAKVALPLAGALAYGTYNAYQDRFHGPHTREILTHHDHYRGYGRRRQKGGIVAPPGRKMVYNRLTKRYEYEGYPGIVF